MSVYLFIFSIKVIYVMTILNNFIIEISILFRYIIIDSCLYINGEFIFGIIVYLLWFIIELSGKPVAVYCKSS